jgi:hypothetical protein
MRRFRRFIRNDPHEGEPATKKTELWILFDRDTLYVTANPVWQVQVGRFEGGWTLDAAVPFKSLRYRPREGQIWGFNARRVNRWKNEVSYMTRIPAAMTLRGHFLASVYEQRDTTAQRFPTLASRALIIKVNRLFRF